MKNCKEGIFIGILIGLTLAFIMLTAIICINKNEELERIAELENKLEIVNYLQDRNNELYQDNYNMHSLLDSMKQ